MNRCFRAGFNTSCGLQRQGALRVTAAATASRSRVGAREHWASVANGACRTKCHPPIGCMQELPYRAKPIRCWTMTERFVIISQGNPQARLWKNRGG